MDEFFRTRMGQRFFEHSVPEIAIQLKRIADALERQNELAKQTYNLAADAHMNEAIANSCEHMMPRGIPCALCLYKNMKAEKQEAP